MQLIPNSLKTSVLDLRDAVEQIMSLFICSSAHFLGSLGCAEGIVTKCNYLKLNLYVTFSNFSPLRTVGYLFAILKAATLHKNPRFSFPSAFFICHLSPESTSGNRLR